MRKLFSLITRGLVSWLRLCLGSAVVFTGAGYAWPLLFVSPFLIMISLLDIRRLSHIIGGRLSNMGGILGDYPCFTLVLVISLIALRGPRRFQLVVSVGSLARTQSWS